MTATEATAQVKVKPPVMATEAANQLTGDSCIGYYPSYAKVKGKLQMLLPERTLSGKSSDRGLQRLIPRCTTGGSSRGCYSGNTKVPGGRGCYQDNAKVTGKLQGLLPRCTKATEGSYRDCYTGNTKALGGRGCYQDIAKATGKLQGLSHR